jgi:UPF0716 protein FxsA
MFLRRLLFFGYPLAEILVLWLVATLIGWPLALLLLLAGFPVGAAILRNAATKSQQLRTASEIERPRIVQSVTGMFLSGLLFLIPGFITDALAVFVLIPSIQRLVIRVTGTWIDSRMVRVPGFSAYAQGDFMQGDVIRGVVIPDDSANEQGEGPRGPSPEISS